MSIEQIGAIASLVEAIGSICGALALPIVIFIVAWWFRQPLLERMRQGNFEAKFGPLGFNFKADTTEVLPDAITENTEDQVLWQRTGHLWWLCSDLRSAIPMMIQGGKPQIIDSLKRVHHHAKRLNLGEPIVSKLREFRDLAINSDETYWTSDRRSFISHELAVIFNTIAQIAQKHDEKFEPDPE
jgi:hypothetical protein